MLFDDEADEEETAMKALSIVLDGKVLSFNYTKLSIIMFLYRSQR